MIGGPPATGKSTLAAALAPRLGAALLDLDVATGPLTRVVSGLVLVAPFSTERADPSAWATTTRRLEAEPTLVWLHLPPDELVRRLTRRAEARDENKIRDPASLLTSLDLAPPAVPHLPLDASHPPATLLQSVLTHLSHPAS
ncbi:MAG: AAA family ATPase [Streptosporangiaceae bacterium]